jgi:hypothetical protein
MVVEPSAAVSQLVHWALPMTALNVPLGQGSQRVPKPVLPAGQTQRLSLSGSRSKLSTQEQEAAPSSESSFAGQIAHISLPSSSLNLPISQRVQTLCCAVELDFPREQLMHTELSIAETLPGVHAVQ